MEAAKETKKEQAKENILGTEKIGKLIRIFSIPCIISLVVNALYNIVDQIFIGWGVGYLGNGATNVVYPITVFALAFSLMFGDGGAAYLSLKLGQKKKDEAAKGVAHSVIMSTVVGIVLTVLVLIFLPLLLKIFGATDAIMPYAKKYGYIIAAGLPFAMIGTSLNSIIRADGSPKYAMVSMILGALLNTVLNPTLIFGLHLGIEGSAIATIFSQFIMCVLSLAYLKKFKSIKLLSKENFKFNWKIGRKVCTLGISSFITQFSLVLLMTVQNYVLGTCGALSKYGADIPITVFGIVMKTAQVLNSVIIGIAAGSQPIFGYNYGAERYDRVKETLKKVLKISFVISIIAFLLFQLIPDKIIGIFGNESELYVEFACMAFRIYLMLYFIDTLQLVGGIFFQAIGQGFKSAIISLSRQILILIPALLLFAKLFGINGVLYAGPFADGVAFLVTLAFLIIELKKISSQKTETKAQLVGETTQGKLQTDKVIITISREYGSGGRYIGKLLSEKLGVKLYDKEFVMDVAKETGLSPEFIENNEQRRAVLSSLNNGYYFGLNNSDELFLKESEMIKEIAERESCIIVGRCADYILRDRKNVLKVFVYSDMDDKVARAVKYYGMDEKKARKEIQRIDKLRGNHYNYYTGNEWRDYSNYDICINSDVLGVENAADMIAKAVAKVN